MNLAEAQREYENNDMCCNGDNASLKDQADSLAETYSATLFAKGEIIIADKTYLFQEVLDEDLDNILELQRAIHPDPSLDFTESAEHFAEAAVAFRKAQDAVVDGWAIQIAREMVGL